MSFEKPWGNYLLDGITETLAPQTISFWPQTLAWQFIFLLLILFAIKKGFLFYKKYQDNSYRREALTWLEQCSLTSEEDVRQLPTLLRKTALLACELASKNNTYKNTLLVETHREKVTQLSGNLWVAWLDEHCDKTRFCQQSTTLSPAKLLSQLAYIPKLDLNDSELNKALKLLCLQIKIWIKHHHFPERKQLKSLGEQT